MDEQEKLKVKEIQKETFEVYATDKPIPNGKTRTKEDYYKIYDGSFYDIDGKDIAEQLENIYQTVPNCSVGMVIAINRQNGKTAYRVAERGFAIINREEWERSPEETNNRIQNANQHQEEQNKITAVNKKSRGR